MRLTALVLALAASSACIEINGADIGRYVEREEKRFTVSGRPALSVSTFDGSIEVRPWDRADVEVVVEKHAGSKQSASTIDVDAQQNGNTIRVDVRVPALHAFGFHMNRSAKLIVSVPAGTDLTARSGDGSIDIERINGAIDLHSGDGTIKGRSLGGDVVVTTGDGSVAIDGAFASLRAHTGDGSLRVTAAAGSHASKDWDLSTGDGSVSVTLPHGFDAEIDAHTGDGGITLHDVTLSDVTGRIGRNSVKGRLGAGGPTVRIRTGDGSITLRSDRPSETGDSR
ncbi:MAG TPA: DUF4097 family beta strand repeat-containing protein [Vicinamibacterales bacterium]|nr:DUF4097 family beta strand repeat-containing protein [Vicinamibacterales bacterium]